MTTQRVVILLKSSRFCCHACTNVLKTSIYLIKWSFKGDFFKIFSRMWSRLSAVHLHHSCVNLVKNISFWRHLWNQCIVVSSACRFSLCSCAVLIFILYFYARSCYLLEHPLFLHLCTIFKFIKMYCLLIFCHFRLLSTAPSPQTWPSQKPPRSLASGQTAGPTPSMAWASLQNSSCSR